MAAASVEPGAARASRDLSRASAPGGGRRPLAALPCPLAILAEADLEKHQTRRRHQAETDQPQRERLTPAATYDRSAHNPGQDQQPGRTERD